MRIQKLIILLILNFVYYGCLAQEKKIKSKVYTTESIAKIKEIKFPKPVGYVNDFENILTEDQKNRLAKFLADYEQKTTNEIAIITISSIEPYTDFNQYAGDLANSWGVGKKGKNNGLVIVFSKSLKKIHISTGIGTERIMPDEFCKNVIEQYMVPEFRKGEYYSGIFLGLAELIRKWL